MPLKIQEQNPVCILLSSLTKFCKSETFIFNNNNLQLLKIYLQLSLSLCFALLLASHQSYAQRQLVVLKYDEVVAHFSVGQNFAFKYKGNSDKISTYIQALSDTEVITHDDTVSLYEIDKIYFEQHAVHRTIGAALVMAGVGRFLIDQINNIAVHGNQPSLDSEVNQFSLSTVTVGLPLFLIKKRSQRMLYKYKAIIVNQDSHLYQNPEEYLSPYLYGNK